MENVSETKSNPDSMADTPILSDGALDEKGFVFIDKKSRPYWCRMYCGAPWFMYWHEAQKSWVTYRQVNQSDIWAAHQMAIPEEQAEIYHKLHRKFIGVEEIKSAVR